MRIKSKTISIKRPGEKYKKAVFHNATIHCVASLHYIDLNDRFTSVHLPKRCNLLNTNYHIELEPMYSYVDLILTKKLYYENQIINKNSPTTIFLLDGMGSF